MVSNGTDFDCTCPAHKRIVIVGGGFAGAALAPPLIAGLPADWEVVLVSEESSTTFSPMLPEVVGAAIFPEQVAAPLREILRTRRGGGRFIMGRVYGIDRQQRSIAISTLNGERTLSYNHLVLALGTRARLDLLPGMADHALPVKTIGDALHIRNRILERLAQIELEPDAARREALGRFLVVGGGFSGVEVAGAMACFLKSACRFYPRVDPATLRISLVQDLDRLIPELPERLGRAALKTLRGYGIDVHLKTGVREIDAEGALLGTGARITAATVIGTIGARANPLITALALPMHGNRLATEADFRLAADPAIWAVGDCASLSNAFDGKSCPPTAQFAVREGRWLARNLLAVVHGKPTLPFRYRPRGSMAVIGHLNGVADIFGLHLSGLPAWLLWRAYYLSQMPSFGRKLRIFVEWTWAMAFPLDITHLRFLRSIDREVDTPAMKVPVRN